MRRAKEYFPEVQEFFFDDDTFTDDLKRSEVIAHGMGEIGVPWSCNAKANVPYETLKVLKDNGLRLFVVGYETGQPRHSHQISRRACGSTMRGSSPRTAISSASPFMGLS
jgi:hypothetical protein